MGGEQIRRALIEVRGLVVAAGSRHDRVGVDPDRVAKDVERAVARRELRPLRPRALLPLEDVDGASIGIRADVISETADDGRVARERHRESETVVVRAVGRWSASPVASRRRLRARRHRRRLDRRWRRFRRWIQLLPWRTNT